MRNVTQNMYIICSYSFWRHKMIDSNSLFSDDLETFFQQGRSGKLTLPELETRKNAIFSQQNNLLFNNDIEVAKIERQLKKIKLNQISLKTDLQEAVASYQKIIEANQDKIQFMKDQYDQRIQQLKNQIQEKNKSIQESIKEEEIKDAELSEVIQKLRKKEQKYYSKAASSELYQKCLEMQKETKSIIEEINKAKAELEKRKK